MIQTLSNCVKIFFPILSVLKNVVSAILRNNSHFPLVISNIKVIIAEVYMPSIT